MKSLNLGILAHVDAGKTSLTERLLYDAGAIDHLGSVERGDTQTDTLSVERERGITIRSGVVSFEIGRVSVNLIDTPGHPDFIAEVERVLRILDGALLVLSAVEGVQPQTRVLMRALARLEIPTLLFVNKIDREGAREETLLREVGPALGLTIVAMGSTSALGTKEADFKPWAEDDSAYRSMLVETLGTQDEQILRDYVEDENQPPIRRLLKALRAQTQQGFVRPVFFGSARTGAGINSLMSGIARLLPASTPGDPDAPTSGTVFKIERGEARGKIAYVRLFSGTVRTRDRLIYGPGHEDKVTAIATADRRHDQTGTSVSAGHIAKIWGLHHVQIGDQIGQVGTDERDHQFAPLTMESVIQACDPADGARLRVALGELSEQDPLIRVQDDDGRRGMSVSLYGEVQKEIIQSTLADDYGIGAVFRQTTTIYIERPRRTGEAAELLTSDSNPYMATVGLRVEPGPPDSGVTFGLGGEQRSVPLYVYKNQQSFSDHMEQYVRRGLGGGRYGWAVTDCIVTLTRCDYYTGDGPAKPTVPMARTKSADFRLLTPRVLRQALEQAGTFVCEPMARLSIESPSRTVGDVLQAITQLGGFIEETRVRGGFSTIEATMPAHRSRELQSQLPRLSGGQGNLESNFAGYQPVQGKPPRRPGKGREPS